MADINHANSMKNMYILVFLRTILGCGRRKYNQESFLKKSVNSFFLTCLCVCVCGAEGGGVGGSKFRLNAEKLFYYFYLLTGLH